MNKAVRRREGRADRVVKKKGGNITKSVISNHC